MVFIMGKRLMCLQCDEFSSLMLQHLDKRSLSGNQAMKVYLPGMGLILIEAAVLEQACSRTACVDVTNEKSMNMGADHAPS